ncbi:transglutaminase [Paenibacillus sp. 7541]|nr:transglutaminase [Paenibacillus sp. 7541]
MDGAGGSERMNTTYGFDVQVMEEKFAAKRQWAKFRERELFGVFREPLTEEERLLLKFLYAYMPLHDLADYDGAFFLRHVRHALEVREQMPWGRSVPEELFVHFVLPYRVNNENIDESRMVIHHELAPRVQGLSMSEAVLETNYWCHERATYTGNDARTVSPLTLMRTALGRCGEQSTLAVTALRSIGIPARQVYTPRWAHCDSNHAWVEAWADGAWHFIGACEPEPVLDEGWFRSPSTRAMLVNTRVAADYDGPEEICSDHPWYAEINMLDHYAPVKEISVYVVDEDGRPAINAEVNFQLYNFAEFSTIVTKKADAKGRVTLMTGLGDLLVHARGEQGWGFRHIRVSEAGEFELTIHSQPDYGQVLELDMVPPPVSGGEERVVSEEMRRRHEERMKEGTAIRAAYEATFCSEAYAAKLAGELALPLDRLLPVLQQAKGNGEELALFLQEIKPEHRLLGLRLLESLRVKDLTDTFRESLHDHLNGALPFVDRVPDSELFDTYVLCPRVHFEMIAPYRAFFQQSFTEEEKSRYAASPQLLAEHIGSLIQVASDVDRYSGMATPVGAFRLKVADRLSRHIAFVAAARSLGIPARLEPLNGTPQFWQAGSWQDAVLDPAGLRQEAAEIGAEPAAKGKVCFVQPPNQPAADASSDVATYHYNFTLARLEEGRYRTLSIPFGETNVYDKPYEVLSGDYRLTTGTRLGDGSVRVLLSFFSVAPGEEVKAPLIFREEEIEAPVWGKVSDRVWTDCAGSGSVAAEHTGIVLVWLESEREPSKHVLRELRELSDRLEDWGGPIKLFSEAAPASQDMDGLPDQATLRVEEDGARGLLEEVKATVPDLQGREWPVVLVLDASRQVRYMSEGYKLGIGADIVKTLKALG